MKILCPICHKILPRFESVLIHINRVHPNLVTTPEKTLEMAYNAKAIGLRRKRKQQNNKARTINKKERNILLGKSPCYKKTKPHSIHWKSVIKTPCGSK